MRDLLAMPPIGSPIAEVEEWNAWMGRALTEVYVATLRETAPMDAWPKVDYPPRDWLRKIP